MEPNKEYEEFLQSENNGSLSFKKVSAVLKRSGLRILIYLIVALIISTSVLLMIIAFNTEKQYQSKITFNNKNIESGMSPWDSTMDITNQLRSSNVVSSAMRKIGFTEEELLATLESVIASLSVVPIAAPIPAKDDKVTIEVYAYAYRINMQKMEGVKWSRDKHIMLLNEITDTFIATFKEQYSYKTFANDLAGFDSARYNYMQSFDLMNASVNQLNSMVKDMAAVDGTFRSTKNGKSFNDISSSVNAIKSVLDTFNGFLVSTGVASESVSGKEIDFIKSKITKLEAQVKAIDEKTASLLDAIKEIGADYKIEGNGQVVIVSGNAEILKTLVTEYNVALKERLALSSDLVMWAGVGTPRVGGMLNQYTEANVKFEAKTVEEKAVLMAQSVSMIDQIKKGLGNVTTEFNTVITDFNVEGVNKNFVKKTAPAAEHTVKLISTMMFIVIEIVVMLVAGMVAIAVTTKKGKLNFKMSKEEKNNEPKVELAE